jgi:hypothetical protein
MNYDPKKANPDFSHVSNLSRPRSSARHSYVERPANAPSKPTPTSSDSSSSAWSTILSFGLKDGI